MRLSHLVITRFCIRGLFAHVVGSRAAGGLDPLEGAFLERRLRLMEIFSSAALQGQSNRDFVWVIFVDRELGTPYRERLQEICSRGIRVVLKDFDPSLERGSSWVRGLTTEEPDFLITTNLDDDDAFSTEFISHLQASVRGLIQGGLGEVMLAGSRRILLWNLIPTWWAPLGTRSEWRRPKVRVAASGLSLIARFPEFPLTVLGLRHKWAENYLDLQTEPEGPEVVAFREKLLSSRSGPHASSKELDVHRPFLDLSETAGPILMGNHQWNDQAGRIYEEQLQPIPVRGPSSFPGIAIDWNAARRYVPEMRLPVSQLARIQAKSFVARLRDIIPHSSGPSTSNSRASESE